MTADISAIKRWTYGNGQAVSQAWNATGNSSAATVTARNVSYNGTGRRRVDAVRLPRFTERHEQQADAVVYR